MDRLVRDSHPVRWRGVRESKLGKSGRQNHREKFRSNISREWT